MKINIKAIKNGDRKAFAKADPDDTCGVSVMEDEARDLLFDLSTRIGAQQERLYASGERKVLIVLQAMDTGGKDGTIKAVFREVNPIGLRIASFKAPTSEELAHDYLWRVHRQVPGKGELVIFNRSHYEDVLITRVHGWVSEKQCAKRYRHIVEFERMLADEGTLILKFFLHISKGEQKKRLEERLADAKKNWKFNPGDLQERALWKQYMAAYADAIATTSTDFAPWYVVPANSKTRRNLIVANVIVEALEALKLKFPKPDFDPAAVTVK